MAQIAFRTDSFGHSMASGARALRDALKQRLPLLRRSAPEHAHKPSVRLFLAETASVAEPVLRRLRPPIPIEPAVRKRVVIILPGFATHPKRMAYMAGQLERAGHTVKRWGLGYNFGPTPENFDLLGKRVCDVSARYGEEVVLVGWSLGGILAREIAKRHPDCVAKVITMGSPFSHSPYSNNMWRTYELITGHPVDHPPVEADIAAKPPVETVALWSPRDGIISARSACGCAGERDRAVALRCTHMGFSNSAEAILAVARELDSD